MDSEGPGYSDGAVGGRQTKLVQVSLLPAFLVDRLPLRWWCPGNLHRGAGLELHFCDHDHVRSIEVNGRVVAQGRHLFPYGHEWG